MRNSFQQFIKQLSPDILRDLKCVEVGIGGGDNAIEMLTNLPLAAAKFPDGCFDYIYIDAQHEYDPFLRDLENWYPKLKKGGIIGGHDCGFTGVNQALNRFFGEGNYIVVDIDWSVQK